MVESSERVTVHVVTRDRFLDLCLLLESLRVQSFKEWDLIVVDESNPCVFDNFHFQRVVTQIRLDGHRVILDKSKVRGVVSNRNQCFDIEFKEFSNLWSTRIDDDSILASDYLERLFNIAHYGVVHYPDVRGNQCAQIRERGYKVTDDKIGAVGGIVPLYGAPILKRELNDTIFNRVGFDKEGNIVKFCDDGGTEFMGESKILESHHLRSSFLINNEAAREVGFYDSSFQGSAFREESDFCFKLIEAGYKVFTDTGAVCWHMRTPVGGLRQPGYEESVKVCDEYFRKKWKGKYEGGFRIE